MEGDWYTVTFYCVLRFLLFLCEFYGAFCARISAMNDAEVQAIENSGPGKENSQESTNSKMGPFPPENVVKLVEEDDLEGADLESEERRKVVGFLNIEGMV